MNTNGHELIFKDEVYQIVGAALEVTNTLGHGLLEKPYENALVVEFGHTNIPFRQQPRFNIDYKGSIVGEYIPDLIAFDQIVIETKVIERITNIERAQMLNYLKITKLKVGVILNFKNPKMEWERIVL
jgi:GxxExxY protein